MNGHVGNNRFRVLALERKSRFDLGNYSEKRGLATEVVQIIRNLGPPGRFLKRVKAKPAPESPTNAENVEAASEPVGTGTTPGSIDFVMPARGLDGTWEELSDEKAIHKACQVMRDIDRPDRGPDKRPGFKQGQDAAAEAAASATVNAAPLGQDAATATAEQPPAGATDPMTMLADTSTAETETAEAANISLVEAAAVAAVEATIANTLLGDGIGVHQDITDTKQVEMVEEV